MTLYKLLSICDKKTNILLTQNGKRVLIDRCIGHKSVPFLPYNVTNITYKNMQLRISIDNQKNPTEMLQKGPVYLEDIMPLLDDGEKLVVADDFFNDNHKPIKEMKLSPLNVLVIT